MFCCTILAFPVVCDIDFIVITGNILRSVNDIPIVKSGISLYRRSLYRGSAPYTLLYLLLGKRMLIIKPGISKIVKPGFHCTLLLRRWFNVLSTSRLTQTTNSPYLSIEFVEWKYSYVCAVSKGRGSRTASATRLSSDFISAEPILGLVVI